MNSMSIVQLGHGATWCIIAANKCLEYEQDGDIYQQDGVGQQMCIVHVCPAYGEPFDRARHDLAKQIWEVLQTERCPRSKEERLAMISRVRVAVYGSER